MAVATKSTRVTYIILRYMRRPLIVLIAVYAISMAGWILIPGVGPDGKPETLSFFHAFYFLTYTVTTTGFGELPRAFTEAQRMWGIVSLYAGVIAWFYALGSIVGLAQNRDFQRSIAERRFTKRVARLTEPFYIVCGFGNTGALLTRGLTDAGLTVIVVDHNPDRIGTLLLRDYRAEVAGLCAEAQIPEHLIEAGLLKPNCQAVVALTKDERTNLKIAVTARLLNPNVTVVTESTSTIFEDALATLGGNMHIVDPFQTFARYLAATLSDPAIHTLNEWLLGSRRASPAAERRPPAGEWILCGFGRMGRWLHGALAERGIRTMVIEPEPEPGDETLAQLVVGHASQRNLLAAGVRTATGIVAGTDTDPDNLGILLNARALNPDIFCVIRQNRYRNEVVFRAAQADLIMMPSLVAARRMLFLLTVPLLKPLFEALRAGGATAGDLVERLHTVVGDTRPRIWTLEIGAVTSPAVVRLFEAGDAIVLGDLLRDPSERRRRLPCVPLVLDAQGQVAILPDPGMLLGPADRILLCGTPHAHRLIDATIHNEYTLRYLASGVDEPRGWVMRWLMRRWSASSGRPAWGRTLSGPEA